MKRLPLFAQHLSNSRSFNVMQQLPKETSKTSWSSYNTPPVLQQCWLPPQRLSLVLPNNYRTSRIICHSQSVFSPVTPHTRSQSLFFTPILVPKKRADKPQARSLRSPRSLHPPRPRLLHRTNLLQLPQPHRPPIRSAMLERAEPGVFRPSPG